MRKHFFKLRAFLKFSLLFIFGSLQAVDDSKIQLTNLPNPFSYFENLYLDVSSGTFIGNGSQIHSTNAPNYNIENRGYHFFIYPNEDLEFPTNITFKGTTLILCEVQLTHTYCNHFFHLLEHLVGIWSFYGNDNYNDIRHIIFASDGVLATGNWEGPNSINKHLVAALFPNAIVQTWDQFKEENKNNSICFEKVILSDRAATLDSPVCVKYNKMLGDALPFLNANHLDQIAVKVNKYVQTPPRDSTSLAVTYLKRPPPRCLEEKIEKKLIKKLSKLPNVKLRVEDFAKLSFKEQINIIGNTDVLISVHGNGLSHVLFLPKTSCVVEIFSPDAHLLDYRLLADSRGIEYHGIISNRGVLERTEAYEMGPFGYPNGTIDSLDLDLIVNIVKLRSFKELFMPFIK